MVVVRDKEESGSKGVETRPPAIDATGLTRNFGDRIAVDRVSFQVARGEIFGFLGPNGAGKTTTVRVLGTLLRPTSGTASIAGIPLSPENSRDIRSRISVMPENSGLHLKLTVQENLEYIAGLHGLQGETMRHRIREALETVHLADRRNDLSGSLSKGLRQRAALARTLLNDPEVMFLDEPTEGLDPEATHDVRELIVSLRSRGTTVFLTTHRLEEAQRVCDRVAILRTHLLAVGRAEDLEAHMFKTAIEVRVRGNLADPDAVFLNTSGVRSWERVDGRYRLQVDDAEGTAAAVVKALTAAHVEVVQIGEVEHSLEDVYLGIVEAER